jgi:Tfp pilus assembly protein PilF
MLQRQRAMARSVEQRRVLDAQYAAANYNLGLTRVSSGDHSEALVYFQRAVEVQPNHVDALVNLGALLARAGRAQKALVYFERAVAIDPDSLPARINLAAALNASRKYAVAVSHFEAVLAADPNHAQSHSQLARALLELGKIEAAAGHLQRAVELNPTDVAASITLAWLESTSPHDSLRDGAHALELAERLLTSGRVSRLILLDVLAAAQAESGNFAAAEATLSEAIRQLGDRNPSASQTLRSRLTEYQAGTPHRDADGKYP